MLALRRLRVAARPLVRTNATLQSTPASSPSPPPPPSTAKPADAESKDAAATDAPEGKNTRGRRKRSYPTRRPHIDLEHPREWRRALAPGVLPAYDEALRVIYADAKAVQKEAQEVREKLEKGELKGEEAEKERKRLDVLDVMGEVNLPEVRWKAANGMADLNKPVYRHLVEKRWREDGALDLLMERVYQMHVVPDLVPELQPSLDLRVNFPEPPPESLYLRTRVKRKYAAVEPGTYLLNERTRKPPRLYTTVFHTDPRLYTLLMVDPDVPDEENASFTTYLHWLQPNVTLSTSTTTLNLPTTHTPYIPPHPARGTPYHRYVLLLLPQSSPTERISVPTGIERLGFDVRKFVEEHGLRVDGGGVHMWRAVWDEDSSKVWTDVLKLPEPRFGFAPKPDPYAEIKSKPKYI
ncbi:PEBP-like protein [Dentipellis sp. KUC8613]|nr:PEBP-like protein [Dentipellis sp. KUC8613]